MKKKTKQKKDNSERWLLTYSDLITLLMILFVVLYAMSILDKGKYSNLSKSLNNALGDGVLSSGGGNSILDLGFEGSTAVPSPSALASPAVSSTPKPTKSPAADSDNISSKEDMEKFENKLGQTISFLNSDITINTSVTYNKMTISLKDETAFESGEATLTNKMKEVLDKIAPLLNRFNNEIIVEGHTDNIQPDKSSSFPTNWSLSSARACNVVNYLQEYGKVDGKRMSAVGYGEFKPLASDKTNEGRLKNRRVDIIILY